MKKSLTFLVLLSGQLAFAQKAFLEFGAGFGNVLEAKHHAGKGLLFLSGYLNVSESFHAGIELGTGGNLLPVDGTDLEITNTNIILSPYSARFNAAFLKTRYCFQRSFGILFLGLGGGINTYKMYIHVLDTDQVTRHNIIGVAEIGVTLEKVLTVSLRYHSKGRTPDFSGADEVGTIVSLEEKRVSAVYLMLGYRFNLD